MKKFLAIVLAVLMVFSLTVTAFADTTAPTTDHDYKAYKIFSGTQTDDEDDATLGAVVWGDGIDAVNFLKALKESSDFGTSNPFADIASTTDDDVAAAAAKVAKAMKDWADSSDYAKAFAKLADKYVVAANGIDVEDGKTDLAAGYYLVVDVTAEVGEVDAYNLSLLQLTKKDTFHIEKKSSVPEVEKTLSDDNEGLDCEQDHTHTKECYTWSDSNQVAIGDTVHYSVDSAVPASAKDYDYYYFILGDTMDKGLTYTANSLKVYIDGAPAGEGVDYTLEGPAKDSDSGKTSFRVALIDAKAHAGKAVSVTYDAVLNEDAVIGSTGNLNEATVQFSHKPNEEYNGTNDEGKPGFPADEDNTPLGETPKETTVTYTTQLKVFKVDENKNPLQGAEFTLTGEGLNVVLVSKEVYEAKDDGEYWKLTDGKYTKEAPVTADYMKEAEAGATEGYVVDNSYTGSDKVVIGDTTYRPFKPAEDTGTVYVLVHANADSYESTSTKYEKKTVLEPEETGTNTDVSVFVDENGVAVFAGLCAGEYTLSETVVPAGYNPIKDIEFEITCDLPDKIVTGEEKCEWDVAEDDKSGVAYVDADNAFEITVQNEKGNTLPETGGIGTTIFYIAGGVLVVAAAILLITKKRMGTED